MRSYLFLFLACTATLNADDAISKRISAFCVVGDYQSACAEGKEAVRRSPQDKQISDAYLRALAAAGHEKEMLAHYQDHQKKFPLSKEESREALEIVAWGVLGKGSQSQSPLIRVLSMVAAFLTQDARGVTILHKQFTDKNALIRLTAVKLAGELRDQRLQEAVLDAAKNEKHWETKLAAVSNIGKMGIKQGRPLLDGILNHPRSSIQERLAACEAVVNLTDSATVEDIKRLIYSDRAGMRQLACRIAAHFRVNEASPLMVGLIKDPHADVRAGALVALGLFDNPNQDALSAMRNAFLDPDDDVKIAAAWALTRHSPEQGQRHFRQIFQHATTDQKRKAAAALAGCGACGLPLLEELFRESKDTYISLNLGLGLIGQRKLVNQVMAHLADSVVHHEDRWMFLESGYYKAVMPSKISHNPAIPQHPEAVNQTTRLEILNILAMLEYPNIQEVMKAYLQQRPWGITGMATALMLTEGDETAITAVEALLDDPSSRVRIQAALVLSLWGRSPKAIKTLEQSYAIAEREEKEKILEGLGRIGDASSIPFLAERLHELNQSQRIIAATALLQCLYN